jgi:cell division protein FtsN
MATSKSKSKQQAAGRKPVSHWFWLLYACLAAGFIWFLVTLDAVPVEQAVESLQQSSKQAGSAAPASRSKKDYEFYDMLPDAEIVPRRVPEYEPKPQDPNVEYILQTGSFRSEADAEKQRATIAFRGLQAHIEQTNSAENGVWNRVVVGPFKSRTVMNKAIDSLVSIRIEPLVRKQKTESQQ